MAVRKQTKAPIKAPPRSVVPADAQSGIVGVPGLPDRVWTSRGLTINLGEYNSARFETGYSSDVRSDESVDEAIERINGVVESEAARLNADVRSQMQGEAPTRQVRRKPAKSKSSW